MLSTNPSPSFIHAMSLYLPLYQRAHGPAPVAEHFTHDQIKTMVALERVGGFVSLVAVVFIFLAYGLVRSARNVQNTFIVFASVSNVGASIASIIALDGLEQGKGSPLCQAQSFLFEMFMQSDPWWSLAMAINVLLVFYFRKSPGSFHRWWWAYCLVCYGGPFFIALALLLVRSPERGPVYGDATIWCWVDAKWDSIRIYTYYLLICTCIAGSFICYLLVGYHVFRSRNRLRSFSATRSREEGRNDRLPSDDQDRPDGFYGTVTTEVQVVHSVVDDVPRPEAAHPSSRDKQIPFQPCPPGRPTPVAQSFSTVSATPRRRDSQASGALRRVAAAASSAASKFVVEDPVKRAYLRTSLLFAMSVLATWIPSSLNRIHGWLAGQSPYEYHVATAAVLPLQGLWNCVIFYMTSWNLIRSHVLGRLGTWSRPTRENGGMAMQDEAVVAPEDTSPPRSCEGIPPRWEAMLN